MLVAIVATLLDERVVDLLAIAVAMVIGAAIGAVSARAVKMTAMPQMVALFNGVGGGAAALVAIAEFHRLAPEPGRVAGPAVDRHPALGGHRLGLVRRLDHRLPASCRS